MKKVLLLLVLLFVSFVSYSQKMDKKFLEGKWETEFHLVEFKTVNNMSNGLRIIVPRKVQ